MEKHNLKSGFSIYFADIHFEKQVYAFGSGLGFTSVIYAYSLGRDPEEAEKLALEKYDSDETKVKKVQIQSLLLVKTVLNLITSSLMVPVLSLKTVMLYPWALV